MANTRETMGEQACLDALVADTITSFEDDGVTKVGENCLRNHTALTDVTLSQCESVQSYGLADCTNLEVVDMLGNGTIAANAFYGDTKLAYLLLRGASKTSLYDTSAFSYTSIGRSNGAVYVPSDLLATYKADTYWKNFFITTLDKYPLTDFSTISDTWEQIIASTQDGTYAAKYAIGDTKSIVINNRTYYMELVGKDVDVLASDGVTPVATTWVVYKYLYFSTSTPSANWSSSSARTLLNGDNVLGKFPEAVKDAVKEVKKYSKNASSVEVETSEKVWIPSLREYDSAYSAAETQGPTYTMAKRKTAYDGSPKQYWLRTAYSSSYPYCVDNSGSATWAQSTANGIALGFCI